MLGLIHGFLVFFSLVCEPLQCSEKQIFTGKNEIFEQFKDNVFTDKEYNHFQIQHPEGRESLLNHRLGEIYNQNSFNSGVKYFSTNPNLSLINSSCLYNNLVASCYFNSTRNYSAKQKNPFRIFVENIGALEFFLNEETTTQIELIQSTENIRVHDLYLLTAMLTNGFHPSVKDADVYSLPEILYASHFVWPPAKHKHLVNSTSAYTVIKAALQRRQEKNIDDLDLQACSHHWNYSLSFNSEKK